MSTRKAVKIIILLIIVSFAATMILLNVLRVKKITIEGNVHNSRQEVLDMVGFDENSTIFQVLLKNVKKVENISYVALLEVEHIDLRTIRIRVYEKEIIGYVEYMGKYLCLDKKGYIVDYTAKTDPKVPIIQGIELKNFKLAEPIEVSDKVVQSIEAIYRTGLGFELLPDTVDFRFGQGNYITLRIGAIDVRLGDVSNIEKKFDVIKQVLQELPAETAGILYVENPEAKVIFKKNPK